MKTFKDLKVGDWIYVMRDKKYKSIHRINRVTKKDIENDIGELFSKITGKEKEKEYLSTLDDWHTNYIIPMTEKEIKQHKTQERNEKKIRFIIDCLNSEWHKKRISTSTIHKMYTMIKENFKNEHI